MSACKSSPQPKRNPAQGFALLVTIVLVSFLVLIVVGLATFTRVETQVAANSQQVAQARQNAVMALNLALGQLQKYAGPDKAVTARGDITSASALNQPYLTGVWSTTNTTTTPDTWLVSGNEINPVAVSPTTAPNPGTGTSAVDDVNNQVFLVSNGTVGSLNNANALRVLLPKQPITASSGSVPGVAGTPTTGNYAWWVGDEGIKASASLVDQNLTNTPLSYNNSGSKPGDDWSSTADKAIIRKRNQLNQLNQPRPVIEKVITALKPDTDDLALLPKILTSSQLPTIPSLAAIEGSADKAKAAFHDITVLSRGVLADTTTGKLRTDFSPADTGIPALDSYIKLRPEVPATAANPYKSIFYPKAPSWNGVGTPTWPIFGITPVMTEAAVFFSFDVSGGKLNLKYWLMFELWNPYAATIEINPANALRYSVTLPSSISFLVKQYDKVAYDSAMTAMVPTTPVVKASQVISIDQQGGYEFSGTTGSNNISIAPGRSITLRGSSTLDYSSKGLTMGTYSSQPTTLEALNASPQLYTMVDIQTALAAGTVYKLQMAAGGALLQSCTVKSAYRTDTNIGVKNSGGTGLHCLAFGYTFSALNTLYSTGQGPGNFDPRLPVNNLSGNRNPYFRLSSSSVLINQEPWYDSPKINSEFYTGVNIFTNGGAGAFGDAGSVRFNPYDLPRQELISISELRHLIGTTANELGNPWGSASANQLFDQAFFSTIPQNYNWSPSGSEPRPNRYLEIYKPSGLSEPTLTELRDKLKSARYQLIRGAFNINSTSIAAWKAMLGSPDQINWDFPTASPASNAFATTTLRNAFFRTPAGAKEVNWMVMTNSLPAVAASAKLVGYSNQHRNSLVGRQLSDLEVDRLATQIVAQIKSRGKPFLSLYELIGTNYIRSNKGDVPSASAWDQGFLEFAINTTTSDINQGKGLNGDYMTGGSGSYGADCVTQADILAKIAPYIAARSDTFTIRAYGDSQNPITSVVQGRAWCEATVQRLPDLVSDPAADVVTVADPPIASNPFGRRFKIISFRWLTTTDL